MKDYRDKVNAQHAPRELVEQTIQRIHMEEQVTDEEALSVSDINMYKRKTANRVGAIAAAAACFAACLIIYMGISASSRFTYAEVSDVMFRDRLAGMHMEEWNLQEYETYLGAELIELPAKYEPVTSKIYVEYDEGNENVLADEGTFYLEGDGSIVILKASKSGLEVPQELLSGAGTDIGGTVVYVGEDVGNNRLVAAFWQGEVEYYLICNDMSKRQFEKLLKSIF